MSSPRAADDVVANVIAKLNARLDAVLRLLQLLNTPRDVRVLAPLAIREIYYRVLMGGLGPRLRELVVGRQLLAAHRVRCRSVKAALRRGRAHRRSGRCGAHEHLKPASPLQAGHGHVTSAISKAITAAPSSPPDADRRHRRCRRGSPRGLRKSIAVQPRIPSPVGAPPRAEIAQVRSVVQAWAQNGGCAAY